MERLVRNQFSDIYLMINMIKNRIEIKQEKERIEKNVYTLVGINLDGKRDVLGFYIEREKDNHYFLDLFETLKAKGIKKIYFLIVTPEEKIKKALTISYKDTIIIDNLTMHIVHLWNYVSYRGRSVLATKLKELYIQDSYEKAKVLQNYFKETYKDNKILSMMFEKSFIHIESYYQYDKEIRKFLFNHCSFTKLFDKIKKVSRKVPMESESNLINELQEEVEKIEKNRLYNKKQWIKILNHCCEYFEELLKEVSIRT